MSIFRQNLVIGAPHRGEYAVSVPHVGLSGAADPVIWQFAFDHDYIVVTSNSKDVIELLDVDFHPGLIILSEGGLSRGEQWDRVVTALDYIAAQPSPDTYMINRVIEVLRPGAIVNREIPFTNRSASP